MLRFGRIHLFAHSFVGGFYHAQYTSGYSVSQYSSGFWRARIPAMTGTNWVAVGGIEVVAIVTFIVAAQNRKQMRHLEIFCLDPSIGTIPPPHPTSLFRRT
jgi:hypothetical protein